VFFLFCSFSNQGVGNRPALPVLLYRTPYCKRNAPSEWTVFEKICASNVFALCIMDVRGRYESDGEFCPYFQETNDGYDCIEWCARQVRMCFFFSLFSLLLSQDFCNGRVATFGISYPAAWQQLACCQGRPPHLVACIPAFSYSKPSSFIYFGDVFDSSWAWWTLTCIAPNVRVKKGLLGPKTDEEAEEHFEREKGRICSTLPLMNIPDMKHVADWYTQERKVFGQSFFFFFFLFAGTILGFSMVHETRFGTQSISPERFLLSFPLCTCLAGTTKRTVPEEQLPIFCSSRKVRG
jgi:hypothetical protein